MAAWRPRGKVVRHTLEGRHGGLSVGGGIGALGGGGAGPARGLRLRLRLALTAGSLRRDHSSSAHWQTRIACVIQPTVNTLLRGAPAAPCTVPDMRSRPRRPRGHPPARDPRRDKGSARVRSGASEGKFDIPPSGNCARATVPARISTG